MTGSLILIRSPQWSSVVQCSNSTTRAWEKNKNADVTSIIKCAIVILRPYQRESKSIVVFRNKAFIIDDDQHRIF